MIAKTTRLTRSWADRLALPPAVVVVLLVLFLAAGISAFRRIGWPATATAQPTPALPVILVATAAPAPQPTPAAMVAVQPPVRWVPGFAAPDGAVLGAVPVPEASAIVARYGDAWYMIYHENAPLWLRASDIGLAITDLAPERVIVVSVPQAAPAAPPPVYVEPQPVYEQPQPAAPTPAVVDNVAAERQQAIQQHLANEHPTSAPMQQTAIEQRWAAEEWCQEHPSECQR